MVRKLQNLDHSDNHSELSFFLWTNLAGLLVSLGCWGNLPAEKEVIAGWILADRSLGKGQQMDFRLCTYNVSISKAHNFELT